MKKSLRLPVVIVCLSLLLLYCRKEQKAQVPDNNFLLEITVEDGTDLLIDSVQVIMYDHSSQEIKKEIIAEVPFERGNFTAPLPMQIDAEFLFPLNTLWMINDDCSVKMSPSIHFLAYYQDEYVGIISGCYTHQDAEGTVYLHFCDCDFRKQECVSPYLNEPDYTADFNYDLSCRKGWNYIYSHVRYSDDNHSSTVTTEDPGNLIWQFQPVAQFFE
ncbi:hypothetical protein LJB95_02050 [Paludibacteraceae bacterium OttesenSCG-928-F17]|nr:hypothetical protein [Paludibacteraceae bacterium OttesenSCG-928-F17]